VRRSQKAIERNLIKSPEVKAVRLCVNDVAANEVSLSIAGPPLQVEEAIAVEREGAQQDDVSVHPQPAMLIKGRVAKYVAETSYLGAGDDLVEQGFGSTSSAARNSIPCGRRNPSFSGV
jgi:hypothetical protein